MANMVYLEIQLQGLKLECSGSYHHGVACLPQSKTVDVEQHLDA